MNKIKLMLTAVVVLSTVGGVLALKATRDNPMCTTATKANGTCGNGTAANPFAVCNRITSGGQIAELGAFLCTTEPDEAIGCGTVATPLACPMRTRTEND